MHRKTRLVGGALATGAITTTTSAAACGDDRRLRPFRAISAEYRDPASAFADGCVATDACVEAPRLGGMGRPSLKGQSFQGPMPGNEPGMPIDYDLHVWAWEDNPAGAFEPWNARVQC